MTVVIPNADERLRARAAGEEHIDVSGHLQVPMESMDRAPKREGWIPFFVNVDLTRVPQKWVIYKQRTTAQAA